VVVVRRRAVHWSLRRAAHRHARAQLLGAGGLKNAIDWASRPDDATYSSFPAANKPVAIMGANGAMGTSRAQYHLRQVGVFLDWHFVNKPEVNVNLWGGKPISAGAGPRATRSRRR
jgi:NAD(P)H-dependent FMN reductase